MMVPIDAAIKHFAHLLNPEAANIAGAGAAGGLGFGAMTFLNAQLRKGIDTLMDYADFDKQVKQADLIITGEGKIDAQTLHGKLIAGICSRAQQYNTPVIALCGALNIGPTEINQLGLQAAFSISNGAISLEEALKNTGVLLANTSYSIGQLLTKKY